MAFQLLPKTKNLLAAPESEVLVVGFRLRSGNSVDTILEIPHGRKRVEIDAGHNEFAVDPDAPGTGCRIIADYHVEPLAPHIGSQYRGTIVIVEVAIRPYLDIDGFKTGIRLYLHDRASFGTRVDHHIGFPAMFLGGPIGVPAHLCAWASCCRGCEPCIAFIDPAVV